MNGAHNKLHASNCSGRFKNFKKGGGPAEFSSKRAGSSHLFVLEINKTFSKGGGGGGGGGGPEALDPPGSAPGFSWMHWMFEGALWATERALCPLCHLQAGGR